MIARQISLFDQHAGRARRDKALDAFEVKSHAWLQDARTQARDIALECGRVTSDDVLATLGPPPPEVHPAAMGAIFRGKNWRRIDVTQSKRPANHASIIGVWAWKGDA